MLIVFEGINNCGKSFLASSCAKQIRKEGRKCVVYKYPDTRGIFGKMIKSFLNEKFDLNPTSQFLLFILDIAKDQDKIFKDLSAGKVVILDRYVFSSIAYQKLPFERAASFIKLMKFIPPDVTFYIDISPEVSLSRAKRKKDRYEKNKEKLLSARIKYKILADQKFLSDWIVLDGSKNSEELRDEVKEFLNKKLK